MITDHLKSGQTSQCQFIILKFQDYEFPLKIVITAKVLFLNSQKNSKLVKSVMYRTLRQVVLLVLCVAGIQTVLGWRSREEDESSRWTSRSKYTRPG